jgi:hypothetical protein
MSAVAPTGSLAERLNRRFDHSVGLSMRVGGRLLFSWRTFSLAAFGVATLVWLAIGAYHALPALALALVPAVAFAIFSAQRWHILRSGRAARLVYHRHVLASAAVTLPLLAAISALSWRLIDTATTAMLAGLAVGRVGCFRSGCCSGRPAAIGPRYPWLGDEHRRLPVQLLDLTVCVALAGATFVLHTGGATPGAATAAGLGGYLAIRFGLDELRDERVRTGRLTEAQRLAIVAAVIAAGVVAV